MKTTLITHIFNEEYMLPFWLTHHDAMFVDIIIIDYNSTDKSIEICKRLCPRCKIIQTRNQYFAAIDVDRECMDIENEIDGIKIILNTTEFLVCDIPLADLFINQASFSITAVTPYSLRSYDVSTTDELFRNLLNADVMYHNDRGVRQLHNFPNGNYTIGRHGTNNATQPTDRAHIVWFGYYPMNEQLLERKLQIQQNIPYSDKVRGFGFQHLYDRNKILSVNREKAQSGVALGNINPILYNLLIRGTYKGNRRFPLNPSLSGNLRL